MHLTRLPGRAVQLPDKERATATGCWVVSSDVVAQDNTSSGFSCIATVDPQGNVTTRIPELTPGMAVAEISYKTANS